MPSIIKHKKIKGGGVIYLNSDISVDAVKDLQEAVEVYLSAESERKNVIFDFSGATYICSAGLGVIAHCFKKITPNGGKIYVTNISERIAKILKATTLDQFVIVRDNTDKIIEYLEAKA